MVREAEVKVTLDTKQAQEDLRALIKQSETAAGRLAGGKGGKGAESSSLGKGFGLGAGFAVGKRLAGSVGVFDAIGEVFGEYTAGVRADLDFSIGAVDARARRGAREETVQAHALEAYYSGNTDNAKQFFNTVLKNKHTPEQEGASMVNRAVAGGRAEAPDGQGPLDKLIKAIVDEISAGFSLIGLLLGVRL